MAATPHARPRLPIVGVMGSGRDPNEPRSGMLGAALARMGVHLLTGGGRGAMASVSRGFAEVADREGLVVGVLPASDASVEAPPGYPNPFVELVIRTHLPLSSERGTEPMSRNHINVLSADAIVALPGGAGTRSEVELAVRYRRPVLAFVESDAEIPGLPSEVPTTGDLEAVLDFLGRVLAAPPRAGRG